MKNPIINLLLAFGLFALIQGCTTVDQGADPVVVNAERSTKIMFETIDTFLKIEKDNQAFIKESIPEVHQAAEYMRRNVPNYIRSLRAMTKAYKANRTGANKANLDTALAILEQAAIEAAKLLTQTTATINTGGTN